MSDERQECPQCGKAMDATLGKCPGCGLETYLGAAIDDVFRPAIAKTWRDSIVNALEWGLTGIAAAQRACECPHPADGDCERCEQVYMAETAIKHTLGLVTQVKEWRSDEATGT